MKDLTDWFIPFLSGVIAVLVGFLFNVAWDYYKYRRDIGKRDEAVIGALCVDVNSNLEFLETNIAILKEELGVIEEKKTVVEPLNLFLSGFWDLTKINLPRKLIDIKVLSFLRDASIQASQFNEGIRSRETYRLHNLAMTNYLRRLKAYDEDLLLKMQSYKKTLEFLDEMLSAIMDRKISDKVQNG